MTACPFVVTGRTHQHRVGGCFLCYVAGPVVRTVTHSHGVTADLGCQGWPRSWIARPVLLIAAFHHVEFLVIVFTSLKDGHVGA